MKISSIVRLSPDNSILSAKYAQAFLNVFYQNPDEEVINRFLSVNLFACKRKSFFINLCNPSLSAQTRHQQIEKLGQLLKLFDNDIEFLKLLVDRNRTLFIGETCKIVAKLALEKISGKIFQVSSQRTLYQSEKEVVLNFLSKAQEKTPLVTFKADPSLISGIRIESDNLLLDKTVKSRIRKIFATLRSLIK